MMKYENLVPPYQLPVNQGDKEPLETIMGRRKRELREEEKLVHKLCKKFATLCDDTFEKTEYLTIESVDKNDKLKFTKPTEMNDIK